MCDNTKIQLKDLRIGKTDAKNELLNGSPEENKFFENSFLLPDSLSIKDFTEDNIFFITGMKGTGKTALLRFLEIEIRKFNPNSITTFILFKSDITEDTRVEFTRAANSFITIKDIDEKEFDRFLKVWEWFFYRQIVRLSEESNYSIFIKDDNWQQFHECMRLPVASKEKGWFSNLGIKIKHGNVKIEGGTKNLKVSLGLDFDVESTGQKEVNFSKLVSTANYLFGKLTPTGFPLFIFVDELEVSLASSKQYKRDLSLIKDLVLTVAEFNRRCIGLKYPIKIICGIRSEVISAVENIGHELNKLITDFGKPLNWQRAGNDYPNHPLIKLVEKRIVASEIALAIPPTPSDKIWEKYFSPRFNTDSIQKYIIEQTWERPRDIIRLLDISKKHFGNESMFSQKVFEGIAKDYAKESWIEISEELSAIYRPEEVKGIQILLMGINCPFSYFDIKEIAKNKRELYVEVENLMVKYRLPDILNNLYNVGIIGNDGERIRFSFRGDEGLLLEKPMKIVNPLWKFLSVTRKQKV